MPRLAGEVYIADVCDGIRDYDTVVRCADAYGPEQSHSTPQSAEAAFLSRVGAGLTISIVGHGTAMRDFVHINDVASAIAQLVMNRLDCGVVNLGSGSGHSVIERLGEVSETVGRSPVVEFLPRRSPMSTRSCWISQNSVRSSHTRRRRWLTA
ncbi:MAG: NAD-dependent epimerase/dehydratase family protein [Candidatus Dormibacteria bacterium]